MRKPVILLAERAEVLRQRLHAFFLHHGFEVLTSSDMTGLLRTLRRRQEPFVCINCAAIPVIKTEKVVDASSDGS